MLKMSFWESCQPVGFPVTSARQWFDYSWPIMFTAAIQRSWEWGLFSGEVAVHVSTGYSGFYVFVSVLFDPQTDLQLRGHQNGNI
jgi:hypothetical protein